MRKVVRVQGKEVIWPQKCAACYSTEAKRTRICTFSKDGVPGPFSLLLAAGVVYHSYNRAWCYPICEKCDAITGDQKEIKDSNDFFGAMGCLTIILLSWSLGALIRGEFRLSIILAIVSLILLLFIWKKDKSLEKRWMKGGIWPNLEGGYVEIVGVFDLEGRHYDFDGAHEHIEEDLSNGRIMWEFAFQNDKYADEFYELNSRTEQDITNSA